MNFKLFINDIYFMYGTMEQVCARICDYSMTMQKSVNIRIEAD